MNTSAARGIEASLVLLMATVLLVAAGCGGGSKSASGPQVLDVSLVDAGCSPTKLEARSGPVTFAVTNGGTSRVSELEVKHPNGIILGEQENIVGALTGSFTLTLQPGRYVLSCPTGATDNQGELVVTGDRVATAGLPAKELNAAVADYRVYVGQQVGVLAREVDRFADALETGDLARAKQLFGPTRAYYERIEPVAESFGDLDPKLDAREGDVAPGTKWTGFHRIEKILWVDGTTDGTAPLAKQLRTDAATLERKAATLRFQPPQLANGAVELLDEVARSKITGEEDRYSHTDLSDFQANLAGARKAFELLRPALLEQGDGELGNTIAARFSDVQRGLDKYRRATPLRFALYNELTAADRRKLARQVDALAEPLSSVAAKVSG